MIDHWNAALASLPEGMHGSIMMKGDNHIDLVIFRHLKDGMAHVTKTISVQEIASAKTDIVLLLIDEAKKELEAHDV